MIAEMGPQTVPAANAPADVATHVDAVLRRMRRAAEQAGRDPQDVTLLAVSKLQPVDAIRAALRAGLVDFGESRAQELVQKVRALAGEPLRWHFVGRLQRNKVRDVVGTVALIHSVDRLELAADVAARARRLGVVQPVLVQVNAGDDPAKAGVPVADAAGLVAAVCDLDGLRCEGLMTVPALDRDPRGAFERLRGLRDDLVARHPTVTHLSMGMSNDFEVAISCGATIVRVGQALFGPRPGTTPASPAPT